MLEVQKNSVQKTKRHFMKFSYRSGLTIGFGVMVLLGFGIPYFGFGAGDAVAASGSSVIASADRSSGGIVGEDTSVIYTYGKLSARDAYPYYIAASFVVAGGLTMYAVSYVPARAARRSRYASRFTTVTRTTY